MMTSSDGRLMRRMGGNPRVRCAKRNRTPAMSPRHDRSAERVLSVLVGVLILKVTSSVVANYHSYFPPDFASDFLHGREPYFWRAINGPSTRTSSPAPSRWCWGLILVGDTVPDSFSRCGIVISAGFRSRASSCW